MTKLLVLSDSHGARGAIERILNKEQNNVDAVIFLGDGVPVYEKVIRDHIQVPFSFAPAGLNRQRAASVAVLGAEYAKAGQLMEADAFAPEYLRMSQAERERAEREAAKKAE